MVYKVLRGPKIKYYCHVCLQVIAEGWADKIYLEGDPDIILFGRTNYLICPGCGHYEIVSKDGFGYYFPKYTMVDVLESK